MNSSNVEGRRWGEIDPLYGVAAAKGRERGGASPWTDVEFDELGARFWACFHPAWRRYGLDYASCLEVGSGAGRMTAQLAREFGIVHAADVSQGMIDYASTRVTTSNVRFQRSTPARVSVCNSGILDTRLPALRFSRSGHGELS